MNKEKLNLIISTEIRKKIRLKIDALLRPKNIDYYFSDPDLAEDFLPMQDKSVAFLSSDILGNSSKTELSPSMQAFCDYVGRQDHLCFAQVPGAGVDREPYKVWQRKGASICNASGIASRVVAHSAITGLLSISRKFPEIFRAQCRKEWISLREEKAPRSLENDKVAIVGMGNIGTEIGLLCRALGLQTHGFSRSGVDRVQAFDVAHPISELVNCLAEMDWLVLACPLNDETRGLIDDEKIAHMKPGINIINVARGSILVEAALKKGFEKKIVNAAYLDVFEQEPLPVDSEIWRNEAIIVSPHSAGDFLGRNDKLTDLFLRNLENFVGGKKLVNESAVD